MQAGVVRQRNINEEMRESYLDYAMSVIVSRALPDARDGLKPVHRRILYAMHSMGSGSTAPYRKSARIVGEVLGKYHPHGDGAVYDAMVRMAQNFSMRYELVDGQGNFGSIDGDSAAAMRYTEARIAEVGERLLDDLSKDTVTYADNFDGSLREPVVLPASIPNLLVNGSSGIAVGMSTNIPPHNLNEVCDALVYMLDHWEQLDDVTIHDLLKFVKGPDFPTGGLVYTKNKNGEDQLTSAYATGRGKLTVRAKAHLEELGRGRVRIIITEIPFQINKTSLIERIVSLAQNGKVEGLSNMRDESDREGLRLVIELSRNADPTEVLADLFKHTPLESTFGVIMLALVDGEPRMLTLKQALRIYVEHRLEVIRRRSEYDLANAERRAHILEGLLTALEVIDEIIATIRRSRNRQSARNNLRKNFKLSEAQAQAILDMRLRRLVQLERRALQDEYDKLVRLISDLRTLLSSPMLMRMEIKRELKDVRGQYADYRRTVVVDDIPSDIGAGDLLMPREDTYITVTRSGVLSRTYDYSPPTFDEDTADPPLAINACTTADILYLFTGDGRVATIPVSQLTQVTDPGEGDHFSRMSDLNGGAEIAAVLSLPPTLEDGYLFFTTRLGEVKRLSLEDLPGMRAASFAIFDVEDGDRLLRVDYVTDDDHMMLVTHQAQAICFKVDDVRSMGLTAGGIRGVRLKDDDDYVVGGGVSRPGRQVFVLTADGRGKRSDLEEYPVQGRAGGGVRTMKAAKNQPNQLLIAALIEPNMQAHIFTNHDITLLVDLETAPVFKRDYRGDFFFTQQIGEHVVGFSLIEPPIQLPGADDGMAEMLVEDDLEFSNNGGEALDSE